MVITFVKTQPSCRGYNKQTIKYVVFFAKKKEGTEPISTNLGTL